MGWFLVGLFFGGGGFGVCLVFVLFELRCKDTMVFGVVVAIGDDGWRLFAIVLDCSRKRGPYGAPSHSIMARTSRGVKVFRRL